MGKTTGVRQRLAGGAWAHHYANADDVLVSDRQWLLAQWQQALLLGDGALLVIDEIQKVVNWPETLNAVEVNSGRKKAKGLTAFCAQAPQALRVIVSPENFGQFSSGPRLFLEGIGMR